MGSNVKTIGVLTSGGDAPGMNAAIRAVVRTALAADLKVKGIRRGFAGLLDEDIVDMETRSVSDIIQRGGTILYTARCLEMLKPEIQDVAADICRKHGIDGLVVIGGDGSFKGAQVLSRRGINAVGIPGTILISPVLSIQLASIPLSIQQWKRLIRLEILPPHMRDVVLSRLWVDMQVILPFGAV